MDLQQIVGQSISSPSVTSFTAGLNEAVKTSSDDEGRTDYYVYKRAGVELVADAASSRITTVFLKNLGGVTYAGALPYGLRFEMSRADVRALMRAPDLADDDLGFDAWEEGDYRLRVEYEDDLRSIKYVIGQAG